MSASVAEGPSATFANFLRCRPRVFGTFGDGAPPQAHIHLNLEVYISGSPRTKFEVNVTVCNRHFTLFHQGCYTFWDNDSGGTLVRFFSRWEAGQPSPCAMAGRRDSALSSRVVYMMMITKHALTCR